MNLSKSIDCYTSHGPKKEWLSDFFKYRDKFFEKNGLGSVQVPFFKRFLRDSGLIDDTKFSIVAEALSRVGFETESGLGIILTNLSYTPQVGWYVKNVEVGITYSRTDFIELLCKHGLSENSAPKTVGGFERLLNLLQPVGFGFVRKKGRFIESFTRGTWENPDPLVILYALFKFAEACDGYYQMSIGRLMDGTLESDGVSPAQMFSLSETTMSTLLRGLSASHPAFINYSETLGLQTIDLRKDKTSADVLTLI